MCPRVLLSPCIKLLQTDHSTVETFNSSASIVDYKFDVAKSNWCDLTLSFDIAKNMVDLSNVIRKAAAQAVVHEVSRIDLKLIEL